MALTQINKAGLDELALDHVFTIGASGSSAYTFQGEGLNGTVNNPTLYLTRGKTYRFENGSGGHPIRIQSTSGASGTAYNTGVTNNAGSGTVIVEVQHDAPDVLYYQCTSHAAMNGILYITGALADGGVTTAKIADGAVTTVKINASAVVTDSLATDAVTGAKIADNAIDSEHYTDGSIDTAHIGTGQVTGAKLAAGAVSEASKIADSIITGAKIGSGTIAAGNLASNSVTTAKIAAEAVTLDKLAHGTSSNDGKFLRANNGADPTFETVTGTTINNNADNRVITGSGTANTLEGEANLTFASKVLDFQQGNNSANTINGTLQFSNSNHSVAKIEGYTRTTEDDGDIRFYTKNSGTFTEGLRLSFHAEPKLQMLAGETEIVSDATEAALTLRADPGQNRSSSSIKFDVDATVRGRFTSDGLCFGSDTAAANALDDYEEGTYTATIYGSSTGTGAPFGMNPTNLRYTKVGRVVHVNGRVYIHSSSNNPTGYARMLLPFTSAADGTGQDGHVYSYVSRYNVYSPNNDWNLIFEVTPNSTYGNLLWCKPGAAWASMSANGETNQNAAYYGFDFSYTVP